MVWLAIVKSDHGAKRWTKHAQRGDRRRSSAVGFFFLPFWLFGDKTLDAESFGAVRIKQLKGANLVFADHAGDAGQCEFEFFRLGRGRQEESALCTARLGRGGREMHLQDGCTGGFALRSSCRSLRKIFASSMGTGSSRVRVKSPELRVASCEPWVSSFEF